jgi:hypothetical protein
MSIICWLQVWLLKVLITLASKLGRGCKPATTLIALGVELLLVCLAATRSSGKGSWRASRAVKATMVGMFVMDGLEVIRDEI